MRRITVIYLTAVCSLLGYGAVAQVNTGLLKTLQAVAGMRDRLPVEKVYLQLDKSYYALGDTLHFKAYLVNDDFLKPSIKSGLLYVELDDIANRSVKRIMIQMITGIGWGDMALDGKEIPEGSYIIRAYTNWMQNFGEEYVFKKSLYISPVNAGSTLVRAGFKLATGTDKDKIQANIQFAGLDGNAKRLKDMKLKIMNGKHTLYRDKATTGIDGSIRLNFDIEAKTDLSDLFIQAQQTGKSADTGVVTIPVLISKTENTDVQFMPEGGNMVAGIPVKIGFKAISDDGKAATISGKIYDSKQQEITAFKSNHKGMGSFELTPQPGESYTAKVTLANNVVKNYQLPLINIAGTTLKIEPAAKESLEITLNATPELLNAPATYYLIGQTRGMVCYTASINFKGSPVKKMVAKDLFPTGIAHFTLFNSSNQPLNERVVYIDHQENLHISVTPDKSAYTIRDSIALAIAVTDKDNKPVHGNFSLAVTDNSQVSTDSTNNNIISNLLLMSDLKGTIEEPGWYFESNTPDHLAALDNLLLTQGWIGYDWGSVFNPLIQQPRYQAESEFMVQGQVTNAFNKPVAQTGITLMQRRPFLAMETKTDNAGHFIFKGTELFPLDTAFYLIQAMNKNGKTFNVGVDVDEFIPPVFAAQKQRPLPWYFNSDTTLLQNAGTKIAQLKAEAEYKGEGHMLKEVVIRDKKIIPDSHNLNGPGEADYIFDEKDMNAAKKMTLYEVLRSKFQNFYKVNNFDRPIYLLKGRPVIFIIDGQGAYPADLYMDYLTAEDIKGVEIMYNPQYIFAYNPFIAAAFAKKPDREVPTYLEITTYSGHGPFLKHIPGRYVYKPIPFNLSKEFYRPRYTAKNATTAMGTDLRSTIHWEPNMVTDENGKATVSFYSADKPADYTLILEGTDLNGAFGYAREKIKVTTTPSK